MKKYLALLLSMLLLVGCARIEPEQGGTKPEPGQPDDVSAKLLSQYALAEVKLPELPAEPSEEELWTAYEKLDYDKMGEDAYHKAQEELWDDFDARSRAYSDAVKALRGEGVDKTMTPALLGYSTKTVSKLLGGGKYMLIGDLIDLEFMGNAYNPQLGSAIALVMMGLIFLCMWVMNKFDDGSSEEGGLML